MGGEGKWDEALNLELMQEHHTWKINEENEDWSHWERKCAVYNEEGGYCEQEEESEWYANYGDECMELGNHIGYVAELMQCNNCEDPTPNRRRLAGDGRKLRTPWRRNMLPEDHMLCFTNY